jgi:hypothetical protein
MGDGMTLIDENKKIVFKYKRKQFQSSVFIRAKIYTNSFAFISSIKRR